MDHIINQIKRANDNQQPSHSSGLPTFTAPVASQDQTGFTQPLSTADHTQQTRSDSEILTTLCPEVDNVKATNSTTEQKAFITYYSSRLSASELFEEHKKKFGLRSQDSINHILRSIRINPIEKQRLLQVAKHCSWYGEGITHVSSSPIEALANSDPSDFTTEQLSFILFFHERISLKSVVTRFNKYFNTQRSERGLRALLANISNRDQERLINRASMYTWPIQALEIDPPEWTPEQNAYVLLHCRRGLEKDVVTKGYNAIFHPERTWKGIKQQVLKLAKSPETANGLLKKSSTYSWWTPPDDKEQQKFDKAARREQAVKRKDAKKQEFKQILKSRIDEDDDCGQFRPATPLGSPSHLLLPSAGLQIGTNEPRTIPRSAYGAAPNNEPPRNPGSSHPNTTIESHKVSRSAYEAAPASASRFTPGSADYPISVSDSDPEGPKPPSTPLGDTKRAITLRLGDLPPRTIFEPYSERTGLQVPVPAEYLFPRHDLVDPTASNRSINLLTRRNIPHHIPNIQTQQYLAPRPAPSYQQSPESAYYQQLIPSSTEYYLSGPNSVAYNQPRHPSTPHYQPIPSSASNNQPLRSSTLYHEPALPSASHNQPRPSSTYRTGIPGSEFDNQPTPSMLYRQPATPSALRYQQASYTASYNRQAAHGHPTTQQQSQLQYHSMTPNRSKSPLRGDRPPFRTRDQR